MTTVPVVGVGSVRAIDLDLDVIRFHDGSVVIDDEDEFADHRELYGYPADVVELAERTFEMSPRHSLRAPPPGMTKPSAGSQRFAEAPGRENGTSLVL